MFTDFRLPTPRRMKHAMEKRIERPLSVRAMSGASVALFALTFSPLLAPPQPHELQELRSMLTGSESAAATFDSPDTETRAPTHDVRTATTGPDIRVQPVSARLDAPLEPAASPVEESMLVGAETELAPDTIADGERVEPAPLDVETEVLEELPAPPEPEPLAIDEPEPVKS